MDSIQVIGTIVITLTVLFALHRDGLFGRMNHLDLGELSFRDGFLFLIGLVAVGFLIRSLIGLL